MTGLQHVMVSKARRGKGPATKRAHRRRRDQAAVAAQQERERRIQQQADHRSSGQS